MFTCGQGRLYAKWRGRFKEKRMNDGVVDPAVPPEEEDAPEEEKEVDPEVLEDTFDDVDNL